MIKMTPDVYKMPNKMEDVKKKTKRSHPGNSEKNVDKILVISLSIQ